MFSAQDFDICSQENETVMTIEIKKNIYILN